jgi:mono/diheme cytochrome c family protein
MTSLRGTIAALTVAAVLPIAAEAAPDDAAARGAYLVRAGGCVSCHTVKGGAPSAGGRGLATPFGTF